jgi:hypothetical protein
MTLLAEAAIRQFDACVTRSERSESGVAGEAARDCVSYNSLRINGRNTRARAAMMPPYGT